MKNVVAISVLGRHLCNSRNRWLSLPLSLSLSLSLSVSTARGTLYKIRYEFMIWETGNCIIISRNLNPETVGEFHRPRCISNEFPPMRCWTLCFSFLVIVRQAEQSGRSLLVCKKNDSANYLCTRRTVLSAWRPRECRVSLLIIEVTPYATFVTGFISEMLLHKRTKLIKRRSKDNVLQY